MTRRTWTFYVLACAAIVALVALADVGGARGTSYGADDYSRLARKAFAFSRWHDPSPVTKQEGRALKWMRRHAASPRVNRRMKAIHANRRDRFKTHRAYRKVTPYRGFRGEGYWLRWLAVPAWVVAAETNGYHGQGRWRATNPSGACGPYQLLDHTSCDTSSAADKLRHHRVAASLPSGSWAVGY